MEEIDMGGGKSGGGKQAEIVHWLIVEDAK